MPAFRSSSQASSLGNPNFSCLKPAGTLPGDMLISFHSSSEFFGSTEVGISGGAGGWARIPNGNNADRICWRIADSGDPSSYSIVQAFAGASGTAIIVSISDPVITTPLVPTPTANASSLVPQTPSFTPVGFGGLDFRWLSDASATTGFATTPPAGYTELHDFEASGALYSVLAYKQLTSETSVGAQTFTSNKAFTPTGYSIHATGPLVVPFTGWGIPL